MNIVDARTAYRVSMLMVYAAPRSTIWSIEMESIEVEDNRKRGRG